MEDTNWLSRLLFYWVNPLMQKGVDGKLIGPDDLFDVPDSLRSDVLSRNLEWGLVKDVGGAKILPEQTEGKRTCSNKKGYYIEFSLFPFIVLLRDVR